MHAKRFDSLRRSHTGVVVLAAMAVYVLAAYTVSLVFFTRLPDSIGDVLRVTTRVVWVTFLVDFFLRAYWADDKTRFAKRHGFELVLIVLPLFHPFRLLGVVYMVIVFERVLKFSFTERLVYYCVGLTALFWYACALITYRAERDIAGSSLGTFKACVEWAAVTLSGVSTETPTSPDGRFAQSILTLLNAVVTAALVGIVTALVLNRLQKERGDGT